MVRPIDNHYHAEEDYYGSMMGPVHSTYCEAPEVKHYLVMCRNSPNSDFYFDKIEKKIANQLSSYFMTLGIFALIATTLREASCRNLYSKQSALPKFMALTDLPCGIVTKAPH